ncbi:hypothetical protein R6Q57_006134 [Mikania cordata]
METDKVSSLVKCLTSKDLLDATKNGECYKNTQKQPQHKKQVRRRNQTSKPYQERLLNMAEARREIVAALKFHRASMKQQEAAQLSLGQEKKSKSRTIPSLYPSTITTANTTTTNSYWSMSAFVPPPPPLSSYDDNQDFILPSQVLGLNLNFQSFSNLDTNIYQKPLSIDSPSSSSTPSSSSSQAPITPSVPAGKTNSSGDLHHAMDDEEMAEIRSLGEQHQIEWNDKLNLVTSARWRNFLISMKLEEDEGDEFKQFDQVTEFPPWLINANESSFLQQHFDDHFSNTCFQDPALPCMDIGEIEAMDGEWLA